MAQAERELISRIHEAINGCVAARLDDSRRIRSLEAENRELREELATLRSHLAEGGNAARHPTMKTGVNRAN